MENRDYNKELVDAVSDFNVSAVKDCLGNGADPNYNIELPGGVSDGIIQPSTPLKLVMFRISDCLLDDSDLKQFLEITKILLSYGADPKPAMEIAESRYGKYDPGYNEPPFTDIWHLVAKAVDISKK